MLSGSHALWLTCSLARSASTIVCPAAWHSNALCLALWWHSHALWLALCSQVLDEMTSVRGLTPDAYTQRIVEQTPEELNMMRYV